MLLWHHGPPRVTVLLVATLPGTALPWDCHAAQRPRLQLGMFVIITTAREAATVGTRQMHGTGWAVRSEEAANG